MAEGYSTGRLSASQVDIAFLLIETAKIGLSPADWKQFCARILEWRGATGLHDDVFVTVNIHGHVKGVCVLQVTQSLLLGRVLDVPVFVGISAGDEDGVVAALLDAVKDYARGAGCGQVRIWTPGHESLARVLGPSPTAARFSGALIRIE